jgi:DNA polymerase I-like protein with 3'-5' exonuclease and polymerase domains
MLLQQIDDKRDVTRDWFNDYKFHLVTSVQQLSKLVDFCLQRKLCSLDLETTGVDNRVYPDEYFEDGVKTRHGIRTVDRVAGVCLSFDGQNGYYIPLSHEPEDSGNLPWDPAWDEFTRLINGCRIIVHNGKFDLEFLYPVTGKDHWKIDEYEDTFLMSKVLTPLKNQPNGLKPLAKIHFGIDMVELDDLFTPEMKIQLKREKQGYNFAVLHPKEGLEYGCSDGIFTYKLLPVLREKLSPSDERIYNLEKSFCNVLRRLERNRVHVDVERLTQLEVECKSEIVKVGNIIREMIESKTHKTGKWHTLNIGSVPQLSAALITDPEGIQIKPTPEMISESGSSDSDDDDDDDGQNVDDKKYTLKDEALKSLTRAYGERYTVQREGVVDKDGKPKRESIFDLILEYRHYHKMLTSYINPLTRAVDKYGDVRPNFNQMGTDTARLSSKAGKIEDGYSGINFQGIPRDSDDDKPELFKQIRTVITPRPGWILVKIDFLGEELRVVTNLSGDPIWTDSFLNKDGDVHSITARTLFGKPEVTKDERNRGKKCNFAFIYGGGAGAIQRNIGGSMEDAGRHMENLRQDVPVLMGYVDHQKQFARKNKCIFTSYGRRIPILNIDSPIRMLRSKAERCAINYTIQSTSADVLKYAMCYVDKNIRSLGWEDRVRYVLTVHDEVVYEVKPEHLMEVVRKLDEWMTYPWLLPKAHGRKWIVPLMTEPGVDYNWRARYDYFQMVDGVAAKSAEIEDGKFKGKLKKGQYFADGRIYQEIPDFLSKYIHRGPLALPAAPTPEPEPALAAAQEVPALPEASEEAKLVVAELTEPAQPAKSMDLDLNLSDISVSSDTEDTMDIGLGELQAPESSPEPPEKPAPPEPPKPAPVVSKPSPPVKETPSLAPSESSDTEEIFRWVMRAVLNDLNGRKLHAACILSEGNTLLRVLTPEGEMIVKDSLGIRVDRQEFIYYTRLFGLG